MAYCFRNLLPSEIECKSVVENNNIVISLHIQAATCTKLLDEIVGPMNWEKEYTNGNKNCIVKIWDSDKKQWISKEDCGGSLTEIDGYKGQASNGFKRVCALGWGIGIALYSQPIIKIPCTDDNIIFDQKQNMTVIDRYSVKEIEYNNKTIIRCVIVNKDGIIVYDGPNEKGESNVILPMPKEDIVIIPKDADVINSNDDINTDINTDIEENIPDYLPDNTDGYDELPDDFMSQKTPYESFDYKKEFEKEITRTHAKKSDVLSVLNINSLNEISTVDENVLKETLQKLKSMATR